MRHLTTLVVTVQMALSGSVWAASRTDSPSPANEPLREVLQREAALAEEGLDRRTLLEPALSAAPENAALRWQAGFVREGETWLAHDEPPLAGELSKTLIEYRILRKSAANTAAGHLKLADWCRKQGLTDREQAHLLAALPLANEREQLAIHERLGHRPVNGEWLTREELRDLERLARESEKSLQRWRTELEQIRDQLSGTPRQRRTAQNRLESITDPEAIPAIERILCSHGASNAIVGIETLARIPSYKASQALARQAVFSPWPSARASATELLRSRKLEHFVPDLMRGLSLPVDSEYAILIGPRGTVFYQHLFLKEGFDQVHVARARVTHSISSVGATRTPTVRDFTSLANRLIEGRVRNDVIRGLHNRAINSERAADESNRRAERLNDRLGHVLADVLGDEMTTDPNHWWEWWLSFSDVEAPKKRVVEVDEEEKRITRIRLPVRLGLRPPGNLGSCLVAGTPVWTETGLVPIEQIRIGDRVLAKDIDSGELAYKPVTMTTVRRPVETLRLSLAGETITATRGHHFWNSGDGWQKTRDLKAGDPMHTVTGSVRVEAVEPGPTEPVYNLVVADFHTYFVGTTKLLSHDVTTPQPTDVIVPGLASR